MTGVERPPYVAFQSRLSPFSDHFSGSPFSRDVPSRFGPRQSGQSPAPDGPCATSANAANGIASRACSRILLIETPLVGTNRSYNVRRVLRQGRGGDGLSNMTSWVRIREALASLASLSLSFQAHQKVGGGDRVWVVLAEDLAPAEETLAKESQGAFEIALRPECLGQVTH